MTTTAVLKPWAGWFTVDYDTDCPAECGGVARIVGSWLPAGIYNHPVTGRYESVSELLTIETITCTRCGFKQWG